MKDLQKSTTIPGRKSILVRLLSIVLSVSIISGGIILIGISLKSGSVAANEMFITGLSYFSLIIAFACILSFFLARTFTKPILQLVEGTKAISEGDFDYRVKIKTGDEIEELGDSFNKMVQRVKTAINTEKTARKEMENIMNTMIDTLIVVGPDGRVVKANKATFDLLGYSEEELIGMPFDKITGNPKQIGEGRIELERLAKEAEASVTNFETTYLAKNGREFPVNFAASVMKNEKGELQGIVCNAGDITDRKRAEDLLKRYQKVVESAHDVIFFKDLESRYVVANSKTLEAFGLSHEEVIGKNDYEIILNSEEAKKNIEDDQLVFRTGKPTELVKQMHGADGKDFWFQAIKVPQFDDEGKVIGLVGIARDITERKRVEKELEKYAKGLERANRDLEDFTSTVSHDLKAPLRTIQAFNTLLREDYADTLDETGREYLNKVKEAVERLNALIEGFLTLSRVGRKFAEIETVDMNELLEEIRADLSVQIGEREGEVVAGKLPTVFTQRVWMKELLMNLIDNGLKFNKSEKPKVEVSCEEDDKNYLFKVKDNGIGIKEKYQANIFNLFERLLHSQSEYEGMGMGLAICKKIVEELRGDIWIESKLDEGSTFFFTIPRN